MGEARGEKRIRLDELLVSKGLAPNRTKAQALILAGRVWSGETRLDKPGVRVRSGADLVVEEGPRYVSRGGHKLAGALSRLQVAPSGRDVVDVGASTGGFTQVLLEGGAARVAAVDVGRGQLDYGLRNDPRVHVVEGLNARYMTPEDLPFVPSLAVVDVSFISLRQVLPAVMRCLAAEGEVVALVKPQFEVGRGKVGKGGIVRERALHREVLESLTGLARQKGWGPVDIHPADLRGAGGNQEYFLHLRPSGEASGAEALARRIRELTAEELGA